MKYTIYIALITLLCGCNQLFFLGPMPKSAAPIQEVPDFFGGQFLSLSFSEQSLTVELHRVEKTNNNQVAVYSKDALYLDSLSILALGISKIDTAYFDGYHLMVRQGSTERQIELTDSLESGTESTSMSIDLEKHLISINDTSTAELQFAHNTYYLNVQADSLSYNFIIGIENNDDFISIWNSSLLGDSSETELDFLAKKLVIKRKKKNKTKFSTADYFANLNDADFFKLVQDQQMFPRLIWYKVKSPKTNWVIWVIGLLAVVGVVVLIRKKVKANS